MKKIIIPAEVQELAVKVPKDKQQEINEVLLVTFQKIADLEMDINDISVNSIADTAAMALAKEKRILVKNARLEASKLFDHKRKEVQNEMASYTLQDKLLLKAKQVMEIKCKSIEEAAEYKEKYLERYAAEQKLKRDLERLDKARKFHPDITIEEVEALSDELYEFFLKSLKEKHEAQQEEIRKAEEAQKEKDRQQQLHKERLSSIKQYSQFFDIEKFLGGMPENDFAQFVADLRGKQDAFIREQEKILKENERLAKEAEKARIAKEKADRKAKEENDKREAALAKERKEREEQQRKEREAHEAQLKIEREAARVQVEKAAKLQAEIKAKQEAEEKTRIEAEQKAEREREEREKAAKAPIKEQCRAWVKGMSIEIPENIKDNEVAKNIFTKFTAYKNWALTQIEKI